MKKKLPILLFAGLIMMIVILSLTGIINELIGICLAIFLIIILAIIVGIVAYKNDVKFITGLMVLFTITGVGILGFNIYIMIFKNNNETPYLIVEKSDQEKTKIFSYNNKDFYTYNVSSVKIDFPLQETVYSLEEALNKNLITFEGILKMAIPSKGTKGYSIYYDGGIDTIEDDDYSIVLCNNDTDVIFAPYDYNYNKSICEN